MLLGILVAAVLGIAAGAAVTATSGDTVAGEGTPVAAVRAYAAAIAEGRADDAWDALSPRARYGMTGEDFGYSMSSGYGTTERLDVTGVTVTEDGAAATVRARYVVTIYGTDQAQDVTLDLVRTDGRWLLDSPMYGLMPMSGSWGY